MPAPLRIAIVGSGPSGFYAADALLKQQDHDVQVDLFDRLPVPYGLVRYGVAPDHQNIKAVIKQYEKFASDPRLRFFGNVVIGQDLTIEDLQDHYHQIVLAVGCESDRRLNIAGEDAVGSYSATEFVAWYNGHPDYVERTFRLDHERVIVVGVGNVAMDVTRILLKDRDELAKSDIAPYALEALRNADVREVVLLGRRDAANAAFSPKEIKEIGDLENVDVVIDPGHVDAVDLDSLPRDKRKNIEYLRECAAKPASAPRRVVLRFLTSPVKIHEQDGRVEGMTIERNRLETDSAGNQRAVGTGETETLDAGLVFRSIGYSGVPLAGAPFDEKIGRIPNIEGRVIETGTDHVITGLYVVGWIKRGPSGLVGSNKPDAVGTVQAMLEDVAADRHSHPDPDADINATLQAQGVRWVSFDDWKKLDAMEIRHGEAAGKVREKFVRIDDMLAALGALT